MSDLPETAPVPDPSRRAVTRRRVRRLLTLVLLVAGLLVFGWQIMRAGPAQVWELTRSVSLWTFVAVAGVTAARYLVSALRLAALTRRLWPVTLIPYLSMTLASQLIVTLGAPGVRAGAPYLRAHLAGRRFGGGTARHLAPNILDQILLGMSWLIIAVLLTPVHALVEGHELSPPLMVGLLGGLVLIPVLVAVLVAFRRRLARWLEKPRDGLRGQFCRAAATTLEGAGTLAADPRAWAIGLVGGIAFVLLAGAVQWFALQGVGHTVSPWLAILAVTIGTTAGTASGSPGGLGVTEAAQLAFLQSQGVPAEPAAASVLLLRVIYYGFVLLSGSIAMAWEAWNGRLEGLFSGFMSKSSGAADDASDATPES